MIDFHSVAAFEWDDGNARKNEKHGVTMAEAEQLFFNEPLLVVEYSKHKLQEPRLHALGRTDCGRWLHVTFTLPRGDKGSRVFFHRDMHRKEGRFMSEKLEAVPQFATEAVERCFWETSYSSDYACEPVTQTRQGLERDMRFCNQRGPHCHSRRQLDPQEPPRVP